MNDQITLRCQLQPIEARLAELERHKVELKRVLP